MNSSLLVIIFSLKILARSKLFKTINIFNEPTCSSGSPVASDLYVLLTGFRVEPPDPTERTDPPPLTTPLAGTVVLSEYVTEPASPGACT